MTGSAEFLLEHTVTKALYPASPYRYESGGLPTDIVDLTYGELCDYYHRHYNPSNCIIFLYGNIDTEKTLAHIDEKYLSGLKKGKCCLIPDPAQIGTETEQSAPYPVDDEKNCNNGYYFSYSFTLPQEHTPLLSLTIQVLDRILCSSQGAYIREKMLQAGIGEDFYSLLNDRIKFPYFGFAGAYCPENRKQNFRDIIDSTLLGLVQNGISKEKLDSAISSIEFRQREGDLGSFPKGIAYALQMLPGMLYGEKDPLGQLELCDTIRELRELAKTDYFEQFIKKHFIDNPHRAFVTMIPDPSFAEKEGELLRTRCNENLSHEDFDVLYADDKALHSYQNSADDADLACRIPVLDRSDLSAEPDTAPTEMIDGIFYQEKNTNGIAYFDFMFDLRYLDDSLLPYFRIFLEAFGSMSTGLHSYEEISALIDKHTGGIYHSLQIMDASQNGGEVVPYMFWHSRFLYQNAEKTSDINREILLGTDFTDHKHLYDMLLSLKAEYTREMTESADMTAKKIGLSSFSELYAWEDILQGYSFYQFLSGVTEHFEEEKETLTCALNAIRTALLNPDCWKYSYIGERTFLDDAVGFIADFKHLLSEHQTQTCSLNSGIILRSAKNRAYCSLSQVQYAALCGKLNKQAMEKRGFFLILEHLLSTEYLWQNIRVLGGAYGCSADFEFSGEVSITSFRDPRLDETISCCKNVIRFIRDLELTDRELRQYIVGTMNRLDHPKTPYMKGMTQIQADLCHISREQTISIRKQIISATLEDIKSLVPYMEDYIQNAKITVIGNRQIIQDSAVKFDKIDSLL